MVRNVVPRRIKGRPSNPTYKSPMTYAQRVAWFLNQASRKLRLASPEQSDPLPPAGISFVAASTTILAAGTPGSCALPAGIQDGDLLIGLASCDESFTHIPASGWTNIHGNSTHFISVKAVADYKVYDSGSDVNFSISASSAGKEVLVAVMAFRGVDQTTPLDVAKSETSSSSGMPDAPSITPVTDGACVLALGYLDDDASPVTEPANYSLAVGLAGEAAAGFTTTLMAAYRVLETAAVENPGAFSGTGFDAWQAVTIALRPAS